MQNRELFSYYTPPQEQGEAEPHWLQINIPEGAIRRDKLIDGKFRSSMPVSIPREKLMALNGLWVQPIQRFDHGNQDVIFDPLEFANALKENDREQEGEWWEGYRLGLMGRPYGPLHEIYAHVQLPREWLTELGEEVAQKE